MAKKKGKQKVVKYISIFIVICVAFYLLGILYSFLSDSDVFGREKCEHLSQKTYHFQDSDINILKEECKINEGKLWYYFSIEILNNKENPIIWKLKDFKLANVKTDDKIGVTVDTIVSLHPDYSLEIEKAQKISLVTIFDDPNKENIVTISTSGIVE